jgi:hypothetical protein
VEGAVNQQERLIKKGWVTGFVDGEGCFSAGIVAQPDRVNRKGYRTGYQVYLEFAVTQGEKSLRVLHELREFFGVGAVYRNSRHDNHTENLHRYAVRRLADLQGVVIPFFREHPLRTAKQLDFEKFALCADIVAAKEHLRPDGLIRILEISQTMNRRKPRLELIRILRDHTPDTWATG